LAFRAVKCTTQPSITPSSAALASMTRPNLVISSRASRSPALVAASLACRGFSCCKECRATLASHHGCCDCKMVIKRKDFVPIDFQKLIKSIKKADDLLFRQMTVSRDTRELSKSRIVSATACMCARRWPDCSAEGLAGSFVGKHTSQLGCNGLSTGHHKSHVHNR
jgi:hypothetical protein